MQRALRAKNKLGFINGTLKKPTTIDDPLLEIWEHCNDMIVDELKKALSNLTQEEDPLSVYYGKLKSLWDELSVYDPLPEYNCGKLKLILERYQCDCVMQFLMGLNESYSNVRDQIMLMDHLPSITKVFSYIQQQERQRIINSPTSSIESIALVTRKFSGHSKSVLNSSGSKKERPYCTYCKTTCHTFDSYFKARNAEAPICSYCHMAGHIAEKCYKLNGYPPGHKLHGKEKPTGAYANQTSVQRGNDNNVEDTNPISLSKGQYLELLTLLKAKESSTAVPYANHV
ncbi:uncharacterized protein LOC111388581 [Olea europaea var. sylvestris]|uniref:uncharacterized protein LOC111388581 n=1 Tax=Olea europaea var. sylvestris TaxID=158386 RepID=UPI000C1D7C7C|nr:uncharacterized protein LOC111388581 [Olea europaea var. sylvestris]